MSITDHKLSLKISTDPAVLKARLDDVLQQIGTQLPGVVQPKPLLQKCKWVLTEFVTNAYKHASETEVLLHIHFADDCISLIKVDQGTPLNFHLPDGATICWPLHAAHHNTDFDIFGGEANILNIRIGSKGEAYFYNRENPDASGQNMNEHFGLVIIAGVCSEFTYNYEAETGSNIFKAVIPY